MNRRDWKLRAAARSGEALPLCTERILDRDGQVRQRARNPLAMFPPPGLSTLSVRLADEQVIEMIALGYRLPPESIETLANSTVPLETPDQSRG